MAASPPRPRAALAPPSPTAGAFKAVLFDLDGVLVDSFEVWLAVVNDARVRFGFPPVTREGLAPIFGQGLSDDMRNLYPGRTRAEIVAAYDDAMPRSIGRMTLNPEAHPALDGLKARGLKRAVVTNTQASLAGIVLRTVGLEASLEACVAVAPPLREKPAPDLIVKALDLLGLSPHEALMVGDTDYDRQAAEAAGTPFLRYEIRKGTSLVAALARGLGG